MSAAHRYNFNRKWRSLNRDYDVRFQQVRTEAECREAIDGLIAQHNTRWSARGGSDAFHTTELVAFHREWGAIALERGWLRFYVLRLNEQPAACLYGFRFGGTFYFYQSSFDAAFTQSSVGLITMGVAIQCAIGEGAAEFDLLHGSEAYKSHWSRESRDLGRLESFPPGGAGSLYRLSLEFGRFLRRMNKRTRRNDSKPDQIGSRARLRFYRHGQTLGFTLRPPLHAARDRIPPRGGGFSIERPDLHPLAYC